MKFKIGRKMEVEYLLFTGRSQKSNNTSQDQEGEVLQVFSGNGRFEWQDITTNHFAPEQ
jgi:hypothetical protein